MDLAMNESVKLKIHELVDSIEDKTTLMQVMEDVSFYASKKDIEYELNEAQLIELDEALAEVDRGETISWDEFKKEMDEWKKL